MRFDPTVINPKKVDGSYQDYLDDQGDYSVVPWRAAGDPSNGWSIPFVTNHNYRIHWAEGLDFTQLKFEMSEHWTENDGNIIINMNFTDVREAVNFTTNYGKGVQIENTTLITKQAANLLLADNIVYNDTDTREFTFVVNYKDPSRGKEVLI